jgi:hypothetical protein
MLEIIVRGDLVEQNLVLKLGQALKQRNLKADFSATIVVPPFRKAIRRKYPSLGIFYATVNLDHLFKFNALLEEVVSRENCELVSTHQLL